MGYYKYVGSYKDMAKAESALRRRIPEDLGLMPIALSYFIPRSMWTGDPELVGRIRPSYRFEKAKGWKAKDHVVIEVDGEVIADISGRCHYYESFAECVEHPPAEGAWVEPTAYGMLFIAIDDLGMTESEAAEVGVGNKGTWANPKKGRTTS